MANFIPFLYKAMIKKTHYLKIMPQEKVSDIYHKLAFLKESGNVDSFPQRISLKKQTYFPL